MSATKSTKTNRPQRSRRSQRFLLLLGVLCVLCGWSVSVPLVAQVGPDRSKPPALGPAPELKLPPIARRALSNGLPVWVVESHEVPLVQVNLLVLAGSGDDPPDSFGVASLTAAMLDEGAGMRSALEIADEIDFLGAALSTQSSFDATAVWDRLASGEITVFTAVPTIYHRLLATWDAADEASCKALVDKCEYLIVVVGDA